eukprot:148320-Pleurochrysis_carterae.AAC.2
MGRGGALKASAKGKGKPTRETGKGKPQLKRKLKAGHPPDDDSDSDAETQPTKKKGKKKLTAGGQRTFRDDAALRTSWHAMWRVGRRPPITVKSHGNGCRIVA